MQSNKVVVVKIPRKVEPINQPQVFPRMPRLYLELIENKRKIKQDLVNKEFVHASPSPSPEYNRRSRSPTRSPTRSPSENDKYKHRLTPESDDERTVVSDEDEDDRQRYRSMRSSKESDSDNDERRSKNEKVDDDREEILNKDEKGDDEEEQSEKEQEKDVESISVISLEDDDQKTISEPASPDLTKRLTELLDDSDVESVKPTKEKKKNKYSIQRDRHGRSITRKTNTAPSYAELEAKGAYVPKKEFRDMSNVTQSEKVDEDLKRELLFKFELLRKSYPTAVIPTFSIHTEYKQMLNSYEDCVRRLSLDSNVESYKQYLIYGFMGCEFFLGKFMKLDMEGFTQQQIISMSSYDKLLIELGEKSYMPEGSRWPVELRLIFLIIMNAAFFVISKMIMKKTGANIMNMVNNMTSKFGGGTSGDSKEAPKRKMKGPTIDLEEIPDF